MSDTTEIRRLFLSYTRSEISAEQLEVLESALRTDPDLRREFIEYLNIDSGLGQLAALSRRDLEQIEALERNASALDGARGEVISASSMRSAVYGSHSIGLISPVVAATLFLMTFIWFARAREKAAVSVATIVSQVDASLLNGGKPISGIELTPCRYELNRGLVHLAFGDGVMVYLEAPASFDAASDKRVVLHSGRLSASVPRKGIGFTVETPEVEVVDFGTEFSVDVQSGTSEVHVFDGLVRVHPGVSNERAALRSVDLQAFQAVRITEGAMDPESISIETDRFIRNFDEPRLNYALYMNQLSPLAFYRMAIRDYGLVSEPRGYAGFVLTGEGKRPPHAKGVFAGGSLRVGVDSVGRGARVDSPPALNTGQLSLTAFVYLEEQVENASVATNLGGSRGNFAVFIGESGMLEATVRTGDGDVSTMTGGSVLPLKTWRHIVLTADAEQLRFYEDGKLVASEPCAAIAASDSETIWFGTDAGVTQVWDGRIDEVALFDRALNEEEIVLLYQTAQEELARSQ
ncbi:LamG-like jellyroll fold domain-containing protein [Rhodopirellula sp. SWK7]|uniref:LamG-like jellyroll fold domain-containing protein n=1 Tax=Rhodopirellula sp. SWK7 TaxID=595460 RepID=UPI0002C01FF5|nr:LamG-like jellyroll fold domain-containing protein [Rhodopirellula sp. SWK7]EMI47113.1 FecR protein domain protein [Rhodopirellula sp. SWK7]